VTRYGKQSVQGLLEDGVNSVTRYYLNQLKDGEKQDAIDLLLANYVPSSQGASPFIFPGRGVGVYLLVIMLALFKAYSPGPSNARSLGAVLVAAAWLFLFLFLTKLLHIVKRSNLVNTPKLTNWMSKPLYALPAPPVSTIGAVEKKVQ